MTDKKDERLEGYYAAAESWAEDRDAALARSRKIAWIVATGVGLIALIEAFALWALVPLREEVPFALMVDRQTGNVEKLYPLNESRITADAALTRSFLVQYVAARERQNRATIQEDYRKVGLWSTGRARSNYLSQIRGDSPGSARELISRGGRIDAEIRSVNPLSGDTALVRFVTVTTEPNGQSSVQNWASTVSFQYTDAAMAEDDRYLNPLGFQVTAYDRSPETLPTSEDESASNMNGSQAVDR